MKKKVLFALIALFSCLTTWADDVTTAEALRAAFASATDGATITLGGNIDLGDPATAANRLDVELDEKSVTLDLGGNTLTGRINLRSGNLTVQNGTVTATNQPLNVYGAAEAAEDYSVLTIAADATVIATGDGQADPDGQSNGVCMMTNQAKNGDAWGALSEICYGAVINIYGTVQTSQPANTDEHSSAAVFVYGKIKGASANNAVNIYDGSVITSANAAGIAIHGLADVTIEDGAKVTGVTGICVKSGTLNVEGGEITSTGDGVANPAPFGNGTEMTGAAVSVTSTYAPNGPINVNISGGEFNCDGSNNPAALFINAAYDGKPYGQNIPAIAVSGGEFNAPISVGDLGQAFNDQFITGGTFAVAPSNYLAPGAKLEAGTVVKTDIVDFLVSVVETEYEYNGDEQKPTINVYAGSSSSDTKMTEGQDYKIVWKTTNFVGAGKKYFDVVGMGGYEGTISDQYYTIKGRKLIVNIAQLTKVYGSNDPKYAKVELDAATQLVAGDDFTSDVAEALLFEREEGDDGEDVGPHHYIIHVDPNYPLNYEISILQNYGYLYIDKAPLSIKVKPASKDYGTEDPTAFVIDKVADSTPLKRQDTVENLAIEISRAKGETVGTYAFTATTKNYDVTVTNEFEIKASSVTDDGLVIANGTYSGKNVEVTPNRSVTDKNGNTLTRGTEAEVAEGKADYYEVFANNTTATTEAEWTVYFSEAYGGGSKTKNFTIAKATMHVRALMKETDGGYATGYTFDANDVEMYFSPADYKGEDVEADILNDEAYVQPNVAKQGDGPAEFDIVLVADANGKYGNSTNYEFVPATENGKLVIGRATLTVVANGTKVYGSTKPETYTFTITGMTEEEAAAYASTYSMEPSREAGQTVGSYKVTVTGPSVIGAAGSGYTIIYLPGTFTITKAPLTIYAVSDTKRADEDDPEPWNIEVGENQLVNGDQLEDIITTTEYYGRNNQWNGTRRWSFTEWNYNQNTREVPNFAVTRANAQNNAIGEYAVTNITTTRATEYNETLKNYNYTLEVKEGAKLTITGIDVTVKVKDAEITYGSKYTPDLEFVAPATGYNNYQKAQIIAAIKATTEPVNVNGVQQNKIALEYDVPEALVVLGSPYTISVKNGKPAVVSGIYNVTYQTGTLTVKPYELAVKANDQGLAYMEDYNPYDVTINDVAYSKGTNELPTGDKLEDVLKLYTDVSKVGANKNAFTLKKDLAKSSNYTINDLEDNVTNAWLTIDPLAKIPLGEADLAELLGKSKTEWPLKKVLADHVGKTVTVILPSDHVPMRANEWYSFVLPFDIRVRDLSSKLGWCAPNVLDTEKSEGKSVHFKLETYQIDANTPFIVKVDQPIASSKAPNFNSAVPEDEQLTFANKGISFAGVTIADFDYEKKKPGAVEEEVVQFIGTYESMTIKNADEWFLNFKSGSSDPRKFYYANSENGSPIYETEAYAKTTVAGSEANVRISIEEPDGTTTVINGVDADAEAVAAEGWYTINGVKLEGEPTTTGTYIFNGKKVFIQK